MVSVTVQLTSRKLGKHVESNFLTVANLTKWPVAKDWSAAKINKTHSASHFLHDCRFPW